MQASRVHGCARYRASPRPPPLLCGRRTHHGAATALVQTAVMSGHVPATRQRTSRCFSTSRGSSEDDDEQRQQQQQRQQQDAQGGAGRRQQQQQQSGASEPKTDWFHSEERGQALQRTEAQVLRVGLTFAIVVLAISSIGSMFGSEQAEQGVGTHDDEDFEKQRKANIYGDEQDDTASFQEDAKEEERK